MTSKERNEETNLQRFIGCLGGMNRWATIDEFVDALDESNFWDKAFYSKVEAHAKKQFIRRMIRRAKDETDWPIWANVKIQDAATGTEVRVYKQESLFEIADYAQVCTYHH
jgi:abortive infection bacteriophage resistance protein